MRNKFAPTVIALTLLSGFVFCGFASPASGAEAPKTIKIGAMISLTGPDGAVGGPAKAGYELAIDEINQAGGVMVKAYGKKIPLELVLVDMETDPEKAIARAEHLNSQNVPVAVGTTLAAAAAEILEKDRLPFVVCFMTIRAVQDRGFKYFFNISPLNDTIPKTVFDVFGTLPKGTMPTKWAFIKQQTDYTTELFGFAKQMAAKRGIKVVYEGEYAPLTPDLSAVITGAKNAGAEVVFSQPNPPDGVTMLKQMAQLGYKPKANVIILASDDPSWGKLGALGDYAIGAPEWHPDLKYPGVSEFNEAIKAKTGQLPFPYTGPAYATIKIVAAAIEKAGSLDRAAIRDAVAATDMMTVAGPTKFGPNNGRINDMRPAIQWQKGKMELIWPVNQKAKLIYPIPGK